MTDLSIRIGQFEYADSELVIIGDYLDETYYFGSFTYPNGEWKGTITKVFQFHYGEEQWHVTGLSLSTKYATVGTTTEAAYRVALSGNDIMVGSHEADKLVGYAGNDRLTGGGGGDLLQGRAGSDTLLGQSGRDRLSGARAGILSSAARTTTHSREAEARM